jgi:Na+/glutamate symporter
VIFGNAGGSPANGFQMNPILPILLVILIPAIIGAGIDKISDREAKGKLPAWAIGFIIGCILCAFIFPSNDP